MFSQGDIPNLLATYSYWAVAGLVAIDIPPGETTLVAAAIAAATTHAMSIWLVIAAAAGGAIIGDNVSYWIGHKFGYWLMLRYGHHVRLTESHIKLGQYLFWRHGGKVVWAARYMTFVRTIATFFAGANRMLWPSFLIFDSAGGITWALAYGAGAFYLGEEVSRLAEPLGIGVGVSAAILFVIAAILLRRHAQELQKKAEEAIPRRPHLGKDGHPRE